MLIVGVSESEVEAALERGVGPDLPAGARCPGCEGELGRWGGYRRWVRRAGEILPLRVHRAICRSCERTHALLPSFLYSRRLDLAELIFNALVMAAEGRGHRPAAVAAGVPDETARGWLRRARRIADARRPIFAALASELGVAPGRSPPRGSPVAWLLEAIASAHRAVCERFGARAAGSVAAFSSAACGGSLLANTDPPFPGARGAARVPPASTTDEGGLT